MFLEWFSMALAGGCLLIVACLALRSSLSKKEGQVSLLTRVPLRVPLGCLVLLGAAVGVYAWSQSVSEPITETSGGDSLQVEKKGKPEIYTAGSGFIENERYGVGKTAPDLDLVGIEGTEKVRLLEGASQKPLVLVFGNFGCPYFCARTDLIAKLQEAYQGRAEFRLVYIEIQHDEPVFMKAVVADPNLPATDKKNRVARIRAAMDWYGLSMQFVLDEEDNRAQNAYRAFPARLVIVDGKGKVGFDSGSIFKTGLDIAGATEWLDAHLTNANDSTMPTPNQHTGD